MVLILLVIISVCVFLSIFGVGGVWFGSDIGFDTGIDMSIFNMEKLSNIDKDLENYKRYQSLVFGMD